MTQRQMNPGNGILFKNERKESENHPDYTGRCVRPDGVECWYSAWIKEGAKGKYMTTSIGKPVEETNREGAAQARQANGEGGGSFDGPADDEGPPFITRNARW